MSKEFDTKHTLIKTIHVITVLRLQGSPSNATLRICFAGGEGGESPEFATPKLPKLCLQRGRGRRQKTGVFSCQKTAHYETLSVSH